MREYLLQRGFFSALVESETQFGDTRAPMAALGRLRRWGSGIVYLLTRPAWITESRHPSQPVPEGPSTRCDQLRRRAGGAHGFRRLRQHRGLRGRGGCT